MSEYCKNCGAVLSDSAKFCPNCGNIPQNAVTQKSAPSVGGGNSVPSLDDAINAVLNKQNGQIKQQFGAPNPSNNSGDENNRGIKIALIIILSFVVVAGIIVLGVLLAGKTGSHGEKTANNQSEYSETAKDDLTDIEPDEPDEPDVLEFSVEEQLIKNYENDLSKSGFDVENMTYICQYLLSGYTCNSMSYDEITEGAYNFSGVYIDYSQYMQLNAWVYEDENLYFILQEDRFCIVYFYDEIYTFWDVGTDSDAEYIMIDVYNKNDFEEVYYINSQSGTEQMIYDCNNSSLKGFTYNDLTSDGTEYHLYYDGNANLIGGMLACNDEFFFFDGSYGYMSEDDGWIMHDDFYNF